MDWTYTAEREYIRHACRATIRTDLLLNINLLRFKMTFFMRLVYYVTVNLKKCDTKRPNDRHSSLHSPVQYSNVKVESDAKLLYSKKKHSERCLVYRPIFKFLNKNNQIQSES